VLSLTVVFLFLYVRRSCSPLCPASSFVFLISLSYPRRTHHRFAQTRGNRLSAAETISLYLTEKKVSANPFASEMLEFQSQVDMFKLCSESMLLQFKQYVGAEEEAALTSLEAGYVTCSSRLHTVSALPWLQIGV
jgi:hypothetical protein